ncbi:hypothetical protein GCM10009790_00450 [Georgenia ruanii]
MARRASGSVTARMDSNVLRRCWISSEKSVATEVKVTGSGVSQRRALAHGPSHVARSPVDTAPSMRPRPGRTT